MKTFDSKLAIRRFRPVLDRIGKKALTIQSSGQMGTEQKLGNPKDQKDIVTAADKLSERMLVALIRKHYPDHRIRGEEGTDVRSSSGYIWYIDPIDGTKNFAHGHDLFGISVALYYDGVGVLGMLYFPALRKFAYAAEGTGAWVNGKRAAISAKRPLRDAIIAAGIRYVTEKDTLFSRLRLQAVNVLAAGSFAVEALWLIEGKIDAYFHTGATPYDLAAARIIFEEMGGMAVGIKTGTLNMDDEEIPIILATSRDLADELRAIVNRKSKR